MAALKGRQEKRAGRAQLGLRKLQDCSFRGVGWGQVKGASCSLKDLAWGCLCLQEYQKSAGHPMITSSDSEIFAPTKG